MPTDSEFTALEVLADVLKPLHVPTDALDKLVHQHLSQY